MTPLTLANTAIVADSTCDPPRGYFDRQGMRMVPLKVHFGDETYRDLVDLSAERFFTKLESSPVLPTTSQPSVNEFRACYAELSERYEHVFSFHLSSKLSGTYEAAASAAADFPRVEVYDTRSVSMGVTLMIERLRTRLEQGIELADAHAYVARYLAGHHILFQVSTLEYLRRGGRIGRAQSLIGGVLGVRPLLAIDDGEVVAFGKVRGERRALEAMAAAFADWSSPRDEIYFTLWSGLADDKLPALEEAILAVRPRATRLLQGRVGAVIGTHAGPGVFAFAMISE